MRIVYSDVDGTLVGYKGSFFRDALGTPTLEPAKALFALHEAGIPLVLVSGRTRVQLAQDGLLLGADGFIAELGGLVGWGHGMKLEVVPLPGVGTPAPLSLLSSLFTTFDLRLYEPWSDGHEVDHLLRGTASTTEVDSWLAAAGFPHLRLRDNGLISGTEHVFHLIPDGISKGAAVRWDLERRGLEPADALAVGDSISDRDMEAYVGTYAHIGPGEAATGWAKAILAHL